MEQADQILIRGLEFYGFHGASDEEQTVGHRYQVDVTMWMDTRKAEENDDLHDTVNYAEVAYRIVEIGTKKQFRLLEALAGRCADQILTEFPPVLAVRLRVEKIIPPMNAIARSVGVEIMRKREDHLSLELERV